MTIAPVCTLHLYDLMDPDQVQAEIDAGRLRAQYAKYEAAARADFDAIGPMPDRKAFAQEAVKSDFRAALFRLYDGRDISELAWKSLKPRGDTPYKADEEG